MLLTSPLMNAILINIFNKYSLPPGEHSFSLFQEEIIPWSICVLLTRPLININININIILLLAFSFLSAAQPTTTEGKPDVNVI